MTLGRHLVVSLVALVTAGFAGGCGGGGGDSTGGVMPATLTRDSSKVETPAARASVANVCRKWKGPRFEIATASSAGYQPAPETFTIEVRNETRELAD
jgi:hypothetical protein